MVKKLRKDAQISEPNFPDSRENWGILIEKFNIDDFTPLEDWAGPIGAATKRGCANPNKLSQASSDTMRAGAPDGALKIQDLQLGKAASLTVKDISSASIFLLRGGPEDLGHLISSLKRASICRREVTSDIKLSTPKRSNKKDFLKLGPSARLKILKEAGVPQFKLI